MKVRSSSGYSKDAPRPFFKSKDWLYFAKAMSALALTMSLNAKLMLHTLCE